MFFLQQPPSWRLVVAWYMHLLGEWICRTPVLASIYLFWNSPYIVWHIFHRDGGLPASIFFSRIHPKLQVPLNALYLNLVLVIIFGIILLGSTRYAQVYYVPDISSLDANHWFLSLVLSMRSYRPRLCCWTSHMGSQLQSTVFEDAICSPRGILCFPIFLAGYWI